MSDVCIYIRIYCQWKVNEIKAPPSSSFKKIYVIHLLRTYLFMKWNEEYFFQFLWTAINRVLLSSWDTYKWACEITVISNSYDRGPHMGGSNSGVFNLKLNALSTWPRIHKGEIINVIFLNIGDFVWTFKGRNFSGNLIWRIWQFFDLR